MTAEPLTLTEPGGIDTSNSNGRRTARKKQNDKRRGSAETVHHEIVVQSSPDITTYGTSRFALLGSGLVKNLSDLPPPEPPRRIVHPKQDLSPLKARFDEAVTRARHWRHSHQG